MSDERLVIDYLTEGERRGYNFVTPTHRYPEAVVKQIWQNAMPRGQGWGAYTGITSLKCFPVGSGRVAISEVTVTDREDEGGRRGLRRAEITVIPAGDYPQWLRTRIGSLPHGIREDARLILDDWRRKRTLERAGKQAKKTDQLIVTHPFSSVADWRVVEAVLLKLAIEPVAWLRRWPQPIGLTTLALSPHGESALVGVPADRDTSGKVAVVNVS